MSGSEVDSSPAGVASSNSSSSPVDASSSPSDGMPRSRKPGSTTIKAFGSDAMEIQLGAIASSDIAEAQAASSESASSSPAPDSDDNGSGSGSGHAGTVAKTPTERRPSASQKAEQKHATNKGPHGPSVGFTAAGVKFDVPDTLNTTEIFLPQNLSLGSALSGALFLTAAALTFWGDLGVWVNVCIFFFWRTSYDLGLGLILRAQSEHQWFLRHYIRIYGQGGWKAALLDHLATRQLAGSVRREKSITSYPQEFRAWLVYKNLVNIILVNDGLTYLLLWFKCFRFPEEITLLVLGQYALGVFLGVFNYWAKVDAHRCIGEYCWYWGDFFFRKDLHLTFDGIFELFPHPMYTVGYALYYGASLMARSYTLLFVSLIAHGAQLAFLFFVEEPHIKRTYGTSSPIDKSKLAVLYDPKSGWFPDKNDNVFLANFDLFRSGDLAVILVSAYALVVAFVPSNPWWALAQVVVWRIIHWVGLGAVLWAQSRYGSWTKHFTSRGRTIYEAFGHWKNTYNLSLTLNTVTFVCAALRYTALDFEWRLLLSPSYLACLAVGGVLVSLSIWSFLSTWEAVGEFGWFYGDFFISESSFRSQLCYTGIYRFLNNPDAVTGYAGQYGLALMAQSWEIFALALGSHVLNVIFLHLVEAPHMQRLYSEKEVRMESPFPKALKKMRQDIKEKGEAVAPALKKMRQQVREGKEKGREALQRISRAAREAASPSPSPSSSPRPPSTGPEDSE